MCRFSDSADFSYSANFADFADSVDSANSAYFDDFDAFADSADFADTPLSIIFDYTYYISKM